MTLAAQSTTARFIVVLAGIDGAGKTTAAHALSRLLGPSRPTLVLANHSGRRTMAAWLDRSGRTLPAWVLDLAESAVRSVNVVANHLRARRFDGVVIMDRHLSCQQALRGSRGFGRSRVLGALARMLPPDAVVFLDVSPEEAYRRIMARGTDEESLQYLRAYREGYLALPEFAGFHRVAADAPLLAVLDDVEEVISRGTPAAERPLTGARGYTFPAVAGHSGGTAMPARVEVDHY
jgi:dTMP kinase